MRHSDPAGWIEGMGWFSLSVAFASALIIAGDVIRGHRQKMAVMNVVYPVTALYWGPVAVWFYFRHGRRQSELVIKQEGEPDPDALPRWSVVGKGVSHCGAGCTLGDIAGEWLVFGLSLTIAGVGLFADFAMDFGWAWTLGVVFQYLAIAPMRDVGRLSGIWSAVKADTLSIVAFEVGLFGGMAVYQKLIWDPGLPTTSATYWMMMQLAMILGFFTAWPVNSWLVRAGVKEKM
jgi:hypothetical protein